MNAKPRFIPKHELGLIATSRLEKYRKETEKWLNEHGIRHEALIMLDLPSAKERRRLNIHGDFKARVFKESDKILFIESEPAQPERIALLSGKHLYAQKILKFTSLI